MNEEALNSSIRKFLRTVGVNSQREIEAAAAKAVAANPDAKSLAATMTLEIAATGQKVTYDATIELQ